LVIGWAWFMHDLTTKILSAKICFLTEFGQTAKYLILEILGYMVCTADLQCSVITITFTTTEYMSVVYSY
jgi:hypothetical protein